MTLPDITFDVRSFRSAVALGMRLSCRTNRRPFGHADACGRWRLHAPGTVFYSGVDGWIDSKGVHVRIQFEQGRARLYDTGGEEIQIYETARFKWKGKT